ncbi:histidine kinase [Parabacteroides faecis]|uniref:sensor histidine kinase n=1 Tax=Parabacteroides faecis TaxID=1217282 RepID=UPI0021643E98|nr:histidine kinase [Parabacteroides faecis]MCS2890259.1 histidine kinase [Parabacteroides faecis]UVQ46051.1 histidine kinase [Parabacteroides faecis]
MKWETLLYGLLFSGLGAFSYLFLVNYTELSDQVADVMYSQVAFVYFIAVFNVLGYSMLRLSSWINAQYTLNIRRRWKLLLMYIGGMSLFLLLNYGLLVVAKLLAGIQEPFIFPNGGWRILIVVWLVELVILGLLLANRSMLHTMKLQQEAAELQKENNTARYAALQNQLNPHFLFNSLNTLIAEIEYSPDNAIYFTKHLSSVYRYVLQCQDKTLVTLSEELEFMRSYLFLHEVRLGNCISCEHVISDEYNDAMLPPLTLQLLVENVIKHNSITMNKPMKIRIEIENGKLVITNPVHPRKNEAPSGVGLQNLSNRCKLMLGEEIEVKKQDNLFIVKVPLYE